MFSHVMVGANDAAASKKFYDAVTRTNKNVEWIEYDEEGHGWSLPKNRIDFWGRRQPTDPG